MIFAEMQELNLHDMDTPNIAFDLIDHNSNEPLSDMLLVLLARNKLLESMYIIANILSKKKKTQISCKKHKILRSDDF